MSEKRKDEHVLFARKQVRSTNDFDRMHLIHHGITNLKLEEIDLSCEVLGTKFPLPIYINAMTGGTEKTKKINEKLAQISRHYNLPLFLGSQTVGLKVPKSADTYRIAREVNPKGFIVANVSANATVAEAKKAIDMIKANALAIHINIIQELVMGEGDRDFSQWTKNIQAIVKAIALPVIVKEVGFGMSSETIEHLISLGVKYIDISGRGGTNFATIERMRNQEESSIFEDLGISTYHSLLNAKTYKNGVKIYGSGGIRHPLDVIKALVLGADAVGLSYYFLSLTSLEEEEMYAQVDKFISDLKKLMLLFNAKHVTDLTKVSYITESYAIH